MRSDEFTKEVNTDEKDQSSGLSPEAFSYVKLQTGSNQLRSQRVGRTELILWKPSEKKKKYLLTGNIH